LLDQEVEIGGSIMTRCTPCGGGAGAVSVRIVDRNVNVVVILILVLCNVDIVTSSSGHLVLCFCGKLFVLLFLLPWFCQILAAVCEL
jgi:hypothetical protein